jgi:hypothetical protein
VEASWKSLKFDAIMDVCELIIVTKQAKQLGKQNADFDMKLRSQVDNLINLPKPLNFFSYVSKSCPTMIPSRKNSSRTCKHKSSSSPKKLKRQIIPSINC